MKVLEVPTGSSPVYPHSSRLPQKRVGSRVATPKEAQAKSTTEKAKLAPVSQENWGRYVKDLEELWKKGTAPRWEDWKGGIEQTVAWEESRNSHPATGPEHYTEKEAERSVPLRKLTRTLPCRRMECIHLLLYGGGMPGRWVKGGRSRSP